MPIVRTIFILIFAAMSAASGIAAHAEDSPVLAVLEYSGGLLSNRTDIRANTGMVKSPYVNKPRDVWILREGDTLKQANPPPERLIQLYQYSGRDPQILCTINVKYARSRSGWRPAYLIIPRTKEVWDGKRLISAPANETVQAFVNFPKVPPANADGFYHTLAFGLTSGASHIDGWEVQ